MITTYTFQRGETIGLALDAVEGDPGDVTAVTARLRRSVGGQQEAAFEVTERAAAGEVPAGWTLKILDSSELPAGLYLADARLTIGDDTIITDPVRVRIKDSASGETA